MDNVKDRLGYTMDESRRHRARRLGAQSWELVRSDRRLLVFPLTAAAINVGLGAGAFAIAGGAVSGTRHLRMLALLAALIAAYPVTFVSTFCGVALATVLARIIAGEPVSAAEGWRMARERVAVIAAWTLFSCTTGSVLRVLEQYVPLAGRIVAFVLDVSWSLATLFALPLLALEGTWPRTTVRRSAALVRQRWAEQLGGILVIAAGAMPLVFLALAVFIGGLSNRSAVAVALGGGLLIAVQAFGVALQQVYQVCLYHSTLMPGASIGPFSAGDLSSPFAARRRRWWQR